MYYYFNFHGYVSINAPLKENKVRDDGNIETSKDPFWIQKLNYKRSLISVVIQYCYKSIMHVNNMT